MRINVSNIKNEINIINKLVDEYNSIYINYYNKITEIEQQWNNVYEKRLMQNIEIEKKNMNNVYNDLLELNNMYRYICDKYSSVGNKINVDVHSLSRITSKIDNCISHLWNIIYMFDGIDTEELDENQIYLITVARNRAYREINMYKVLKNNVKSFFSKISNYESDIRKRISKTNISNIQETDISQCIDQVRGL